MKAEDFGYVVKNNLCLFQKGPLSNWYGAWEGQNGGFKANKRLGGHSFREANDYFELVYPSGLIHYNCCEQWMMAQKAMLFHDLESLKKIMMTSQPSQQKALGRKVKNYDQQTWDDEKFNIVLAGNIFKFGQNKDIKEFLMSFNKHTIFAEAAPWDKIWGIGLAPDDPKALDINTWEGENLLGVVISSIRKEWG